ncbi:phospholipase C/P1 nuclease [Stereum hirsutum FP-91666 SS1]|uniref:phospholipase C/P1 nuclease n=1 Tax=Stereum hirsutum (strain FP-91666) TaxID=721885 RepID=UPI00044498A1|nr:phospholipase C/P1 nuclease [Stereum hirsutum FP-91666 SS1]EIM81917.1 phospholipase C/P1 nuclease [Stereum hirsutum FP-91666 SS1]
MRIDKLSGLTAIAAVSSLPGALAWGAAGHEIVATIAQMHLYPPVLPIICSILNPDDIHSLVNSSSDSIPTPTSTAPCHLATVAAWADTVRRQRGYGWSGTLHYINALDDHPSETCKFPGERGWAGRDGHNVLGAIRNVTDLLQEFKRGLVGALGRVDDAEEMLKFLIHFVGDMHQPLHLSGRERGGNGVKVHWDNRVTNLHSLWDGLLIAKALRSIPSNYTRPLPVPGIEANLRDTIYDPFIRKIMWEGLGVGPPSEVRGRWEFEAEEWTECPEFPEFGTTTSWMQTVMGYMWPTWTWVTGQNERKKVELGWDDNVLCPYAWAQPLHQLNCDLIWPPEIDEPPYNLREWQAFMDGKVDAHATAPRTPYLELDTPKYAGRIEKEWVLEKLLAQAGVRLAVILNELFMPLVEEFELKSE